MNEVKKKCDDVNCLDEMKNENFEIEQKQIEKLPIVFWISIAIFRRQNILFVFVYLVRFEWHFIRR